MEAAAPQKLGVDFPFRMVLRHQPLATRQIFALTEAFDFSEIRYNQGSKRGDLLVDVLEVEVGMTTVLVTPRQPLGYDEIADRVEAVLEDVSTRVGVALEVAKVAWVIEHPGVASDLRGRLRAVR